MAALSELVKFRQELIALTDQLSMKSSIDEKISAVNLLKMQNPHSNYFPGVGDLIQYYQSLSTVDDEIIDKIKIIIQQVDSDIDTKAKELQHMPGNNHIYDGLFSFDSWEVNRPIFETSPINFKALEILTPRMANFGNGRYPGLLLGARSIDHIKSMVVCDPLYLTNHDLDKNINRLIADFPIEYQKRLMIYSIENQDYSCLPQNQIGIVVSYDYLNYLKSDEITKCLEQVFLLLRPGGTFIFTYNDADEFLGAVQAEKLKMSYCTTRIIQNTATQLGFEIVDMRIFKTESGHLKNNQDTSIQLSLDFEITESYDVTQINWMQLRKPGELSTVKLQQVLGKPSPK